MYLAGKAAPLPSLCIKNLSIKYEQKTILNDITIELPRHSLTVILGPNGCGKSTLLKSLSRILKADGGEILLNNKNIAQWPSKWVARQIALLPQNITPMEDLPLYELVSRGRYPYQSFLKPWSDSDAHAVQRALLAVNLWDKREDMFFTLSGGQKQRAWLAMTLAQETPIILLDEPTTYLDLAHQIELLDLCYQLYQQGKNLILVLHDINLALRYANYLIIMKEGKIYCHGRPQELITPSLLEQVFAISATIIQDIEHDKPLIIPKSKALLTDLLVQKLN